MPTRLSEARDSFERVEFGFIMALTFEVWDASK
jgi:hypothetical protein